jgi:hypothetical protein
MSSPSVLVLTPENEPAMVPQENLEAALSRGFKTATHVTTPDNEDAIMPSERVHEALQRGFKLGPVSQQKLGGESSLPVKLGRGASLGLTEGYGIPQSATPVKSAKETLAEPWKNPIAPTVNILSSLFGMYRAQANEFEKASEAQHENPIPYNPKAIAHTVAGLVPIFGPAISQGSSEVGRGAEQHDPEMAAHGAGVIAGNILQLLTGSERGRAALAAPVEKGLEFAAEKSAPLREAVANKLEESAVKQYGQALNPTKERTKFIAKKVTPELIERGVTAPSIGKLKERVSANVENAGNEVGNAWEALPEGTSTETKPLLEHLENFKKEFQDRVPIDREEFGTLAAQGKPVEIETAPTGEERYVKLINIDENAVKAANDLQSLVSEYGDQISLKSLRKVRQIFDEQVARAGGYEGKSLAEGSLLDAKEELANAAREQIGKSNPDIAKKNAEFNFWKGVDKVVGETQKRRVGQQGGLIPRMAQGTGALVGAGVGEKLFGPPGAVLGGAVGGKIGKTAAEFTTGTGYRTTAAVAKNRLAKAIRPGDRPSLPPRGPLPFLSGPTPEGNPPQQNVEAAGGNYVGHANGIVYFNDPTLPPHSSTMAVPESFTPEQIKAHMEAGRQSVNPVKTSGFEDFKKAAAEPDLEQARRGAPAPPVEVPAVNQVPKEQRASSQIVNEAQEKAAGRIEGRTEQKKALEEPKAQAAAVGSSEPKIVGYAAHDHKPIIEIRPEGSKGTVGPDEKLPTDAMAIFNKRFYQATGTEIPEGFWNDMTPSKLQAGFAKLGLDDEIFKEANGALYDAGYRQIGNIGVTKDGARLPLQGTQAVETQNEPASAQAAKQPKPAGTYGSDTQVKMPTGSLPAKYKLVEADSLIPSHNATSFKKNPKYPAGVQERSYEVSKEAQNRVIQQAQNYDPAYTVNTNPDAVNGPPVVTKEGIVLGGNSRTMSTQRLYAKGGQAYRDYLRKNASQFGIKPEDIDSLQKPILVREVATPPDTEAARRIGSDLNKSMTGALGVAEKAVSAGRSISRESMSQVSAWLKESPEGSLRDILRDHGKEVIRLLENDKIIGERERPAIVDTSTGGLSEEGKTFVERALLGSVVDDPVLMDKAPKSILNKIGGSLGDISEFSGRSDEYNILPLIREALLDHAQIAGRNMTADLYLRQDGMFGPARNPAVDAIVRKLAENPNRVRDALNKFAVDSRADTQGQGFLGFGPKPSAASAFNEAFGTNFSEEQYHQYVIKALEREAKNEPISKSPSTPNESIRGVRPTEPARKPAPGNGENGPRVQEPAQASSNAVSEAVTQKKTLYGSKNKLVSQEEYSEAKKNLTKKATRLSSGIDPTAALDLAKIGAYHFEAGAREFSAWSQKMIQELGEQVRPHLRKHLERSSSRA